MMIKLINIGFGNIIFVNWMILIVSLEFVLIKWMIQDVRDCGMLIDVIYG